MLVNDALLILCNPFFQMSSELNSLNNNHIFILDFSACIKRGLQHKARYLWHYSHANKETSIKTKYLNDIIGKIHLKIKLKFNL